MRDITLPENPILLRPYFGEGIEQDRGNATKLINYAQREDFSREWGDYLRRRALLKQYDFSNRFEAALLREDLSTWDDLIEAISRVMKRLYPRDEKRDSLGEFRYRLLERHFSGSFIDVFERVAYRQIGRKSDLITMHFSEDMSLRDLVYLEDSINKYYHEALDSLNNVNPQLRRFARENRLIKVRSFTHPGSVEIFIIGLVVVPLVTSLGAMLITNSMTRNQNRRRERVKVITARFQGPRRDIAIEGDLVTISIDETEERVSNDAESVGDEQRALEEVNLAAEFSEIQAPVSQGVQEIVDNMTSVPGAYAVAKSGEHVAGLENS